MITNFSGKFIAATERKDHKEQGFPAHFTPLDGYLIAGNALARRFRIISHVAGWPRLRGSQTRAPGRGWMELCYDSIWLRLAAT